jgi:hypothetical protein
MDRDTSSAAIRVMKYCVTPFLPYLLKAKRLESLHHLSSFEGEAVLSYPYCDPSGVNFVRDLLTTLLAIFEAKLKHLFNVSQAFLVSLTLSVSFRN